ncbi:MAG: protein translocase subunit SecD [Candidatus Dactylopiibacterium carminicum]|uniref:Protein translocase subunit SecD n=1 Tax=Candidatus Dactylopiibacterium carminicum TaxID=857335 RepID=A0A272ERE3_9RHOO|nr:protein translocase subunit SecD [Candidatus Dactylopiibacterium carminicum]KAF7598576.1 protein translocase subunit SecD [Candidatus Dactylopiibacterium carminicum]PAS92290.1 MAG: protein translocase subunit SecD [Candidatus Dactylopiibacterium carminicum]PAS93986.1 MAG: protein translocase subunit SecD [Candidatus Dactylopiibacterium carminicum]PAS98237.1 MAG: protein-export membrane protein SecD [Candidatus Dactylopiibacterium carminicum]
MNRYPLWKNLMIAVVLILGFLYTLPNFYGEVPAVQISAARSTVSVDDGVERRIDEALKAAGINPTGKLRDATGLRVRLSDVETQTRAKDLIEHTLNPDPQSPSFVVALNLLSASPEWLTRIGALPMYLGLDLRGGVHFMLEVDMDGAITKQLDVTASDFRSVMRDKRIRHGGVSRDGEQITTRLRSAEDRNAARDAITATRNDLQFQERNEGQDFLLLATLSQQARKQIQEDAIKQNIVTLHNRVNELGVAEPVIQQQGANRIVVQLPGIQDVSRAKDLIGRTATLEVRMVAENVNPMDPPAGVDTYPELRDGRELPVAVRKQVVLTGDRFVSAQSTFDNNQRPAVSVRLDAAGGNVMRQVTRDNIGKPMAIILFEKGKGEVISVANIQGEFGNQFQITGSFSTQDTNRLAILIRSGSLAAPMDIIEERTIGPSLGKDNIEKGFHSTAWGFAVIAVFMCIYYVGFGLISTLALAANLLLLIALLSLFQLTLTLPGIAAIALTLGMAIDANVLINERIREELRAGVSPQLAISEGYSRAFDTIFDSNLTTLIVGIALLAFGSGPVRGFAVVHCLGILTSIFSAVLISRMLSNFVYGYRRKIDSVSIGHIWKPAD